MLTIRRAKAIDGDAIWSILEPAIRAGETLAQPRDWSRDDALEYWMSNDHWVFVAEEPAEDPSTVLGCYFLRANQKGGGAYVANCGYVTDSRAYGRGVASAMCAHSLEIARSLGFHAMQFNFVVSSNTRAVALWQKFGFEIVARVPEAFRHPSLGWVDALVMHRFL